MVKCPFWKTSPRPRNVATPLAKSLTDNRGNQCNTFRVTGRTGAGAVYTGLQQAKKTAMTPTT